MDRPKPRLRRFVRVVIVLAALLVGAEVALQAAAGVLDKQRGMRFHDVFGWRAIPGVERTGAMWGDDEPAKVNAHGWRDAERELAKAEGTTRIVAVGDSFTFGIGVDDGERFTDELARVLPNVEALNMAACGYGPDQELLVIEHEALRFSPDVVVVTSFLGNDLSDLGWKTQHQWPKPWYRLTDGALEHHAPEATWFVRLRSRTYVGEALHTAWCRMTDTPARVPTEVEDPPALYLALVERMREVVEASGARLLVVLVPPDRGNVDVATVLAKRLTQRGIATLDTTPWMYAETEGEPLFNPPPTGHWSPAGHRRVARAIVDRLTELDWVDG